MAAPGTAVRATLLALALAAAAAHGEGALRAAAPEPGAGAGAARFHAAGGAFSASFPAAPRYEDVHSRTLLGALRTRSWEVKAGALFLRVERHDLPALAPALVGAEGLVERAASQLLADVDARGVRAEDAPLGGRPGRRLRYEPGERPGSSEEVRLHLLGRRLYVIFAGGADEASRAEAERFAASVELLGE